MLALITALIYGLMNYWVLFVEGEWLCVFMHATVAYLCPYMVTLPVYMYTRDFAGQTSPIILCLYRVFVLGMLSVCGYTL